MFLAIDQIQCTIPINRN